LGTTKGVAGKLKVHRRMVREAIGSVTRQSRKKVDRRAGKVAPYRAVISRILEEDRKAPREQRHTAHRIRKRLRAGHQGSS
jgi:hypothetical protein